MPDVTSFTLDNLDRVKVYDTVTTPGQSAAKLTYQYDAFGNRTQMVQQTGSGASLITVTTNYTEYDYLNRLTKLNQSATNFPNWQNKSVKLDYRADSSIQTITRYSDLTQTTVVVNVVKTDYTQDQAGRLASITHTKTVPTSTVLASYQYTDFADDQLLQEISSVDGTTNNDYVTRSEAPASECIGRRLLPPQGNTRGGSLGGSAFLGWSPGTRTSARHQHENGGHQRSLCL